jgi:hypothetical protein
MLKRTWGMGMMKPCGATFLTALIESSIELERPETYTAAMFVARCCRKKMPHRVLRPATNPNC